MASRCVGAAFAVVVFLSSAVAQRAGRELKGESHAAAEGDWPTYGGDAGGQRYSAERQIDVANVGSLQVAWTFHTGAMKPQDGYSNFEATPVLWRGMLFFDTPFDEMFGVDAASGKEVWRFDPGVDRHQPIYIASSRGVALWHGRTLSQEVCGQHRVFVATLDRRLIARDAVTGQACDGFGVHGSVDLTAGMGLSALARGLYGFTSPPTVIGDVVVVGSSIGDNETVEVASGAVRGFDARTGRQVWSWDPMPWAGGNHPKTGGGNAWSIIAADPERDLVFVPTGSPAVDFYGGLRPGDNRDADSLVALRGSTGQRVWGFQLVHHDLWDYDTPSEPLLFMFRNKIPAVAITAKTGMVFVFNRVTGEPLYPIEERKVPASDLPGERAWPTQPFSSLPTLTPLRFGPEDITLKNAGDRDFCREALRDVINKGIFTPPSLKSTLMYPGSLGGANWGSAGMDPKTGVMYVHTNSLAYVVRQNTRWTAFWDSLRRRLVVWLPRWMTRRKNIGAGSIRTPDGGEVTPQMGTPYKLYRTALTTPNNVPCAPEPFGALVAMNLNTGEKLWTVPQGTMVAGAATGMLGLGGPLVTGGGVVIIGATLEPKLRAYDAGSGRLLWEAGLPGAAMATPMSYAVNGRQYVVVAAGGHGMLGSAQSDAVVAFALPEGVKRLTERQPKRGSREGRTR